MKTKFKGTQGKWVISPSSENYIADISDNFAIAKAFNNSFIQKGESDANAKLIANSPELLKSIEGFVNDFEGDYVMADGRIVDNPNNLLLANYEIMKKVLEETLT